MFSFNDKAIINEIEIERKTNGKWLLIKKIWMPMLRYFKIINSRMCVFLYFMI